MKTKIIDCTLAAFTLLACAAVPVSAQTPVGTGNPYLPLWEHLPDGEPRVFEDPDNPGKYRAYIIGSHDLTYTAYCGADIRMWSAPVEDLTDWRDEGPIFTYYVDGQWDVMYAPDLVEVERDGVKEYYLYPHSRGAGREAMVCKGSRPDGPFTPVNLTDDGRGTVEGSILGFDPSIFVEKVTDPSDPDYETGFRAYGFWGFQRSSAAELDPETMYSVRPGTEVIPYFIPASSRYGEVRDPEGTEYPALYKEQDPGDFNFFEASSIRQVGNKYVMIFSGYSGPDYGLGSTNSSLRYAYGDSPLGPWRSGGVLVDSRGVVPNEDGTALTTTNGAHNTHGSLQQINDQWYVFYHRPPRGFGFARQAMVAPVTIEWDETPVAEGGKVIIRGYDPYAKDGIWEAAASNGDVYTGAEVTSEGFQIFGLDPYKYYSAGYACYLSDISSQQDSWDIWDNSMPVTVTDGDVIGYTYFGFGGLKKAQKGLKPFEGARRGNKTAFTIPVLGGIPVADSVVVSWIIMALLTVLSLVLTRKLSVRSPGRVQAALEWAVQFLNGFVKTNIGSRWRPFAPWLGTVALYIGLSNLIGIFGLTPPTKDISVTTALAVMSMLLIYGAQFRYNGLLGGLKKFAEPMPLLLPINLMEVVIRPLALCMRLFGNILGAYIIMEMLKFVAPAVLPAVFSIYFDLFDGLIQTVVFVFLTTLFTGEGIKEEE